MKKASTVLLLMSVAFLLTSCAGNVNKEAETWPLSRILAIGTQQCGDSQVWKVVEWLRDEQHPTFIEMKGFRLVIRSQRLTEADKANGVEWQGEVAYSCKIQRLYQFWNEVGRWKDWEDCWESAPITIRKIKGEWTGGKPEDLVCKSGGQAGGPNAQCLALTCADVPK